MEEKRSKRSTTTTKPVATSHHAPSMSSSSLAGPRSFLSSLSHSTAALCLVDGLRLLMLASRVTEEKAAHASQSGKRVKKEVFKKNEL